MNLLLVLLWIALLVTLLLSLRDLTRAARVRQRRMALLHHGFYCTWLCKRDRDARRRQQANIIEGENLEAGHNIERQEG